MIRLITCVRKKKSVSYQEFRRCWEDPVFSELINKAVEVLKPIRYARNLSLQVGANIRIMVVAGER